MIDAMSEVSSMRFKRVLDPVERISETLFGLIMALTCTLGVATADWTSATQLKGASRYLNQSRPGAGRLRLSRSLAVLKRCISSLVVLIFSSSCMIREVFCASSLRSLSSSLPTESLFISAIVNSASSSQLGQLARIPNASRRKYGYKRSVSIENPRP
jgi:hypothetical protein